MLLTICVKQRNCSGLMVKIINFPNSPKSKAQIEAEALELKKLAVETSLNVAMTSTIWEHYQLTDDDMECLEQFGEVMNFTPKAAARLITKLASQNKELLSLTEVEPDFNKDPWS